MPCPNAMLGKRRTVRRKMKLPTTVFVPPASGRRLCLLRKTKIQKRLPEAGGTQIMAIPPPRRMARSSQVPSPGTAVPCPYCPTRARMTFVPPASNQRFWLRHNRQPRAQQIIRVHARIQPRTSPRQRAAVPAPDPPPPRIRIRAKRKARDGSATAGASVASRTSRSYRWPPAGAVAFQ